MLEYAGYFGLNFALELLAMYLWLPKVNAKLLASAVLLLNLSTHPAFWYVASHAYIYYWPTILLGEMIVFGVEIFIGLKLLKPSGYSRGRIGAAVAGANSVSLLFTFIV